jgi:hypothetical protein
MGGFIYRHTNGRKGFMKYPAEMGSGIMSVNNGSGTEKLISGYTDRQHGDIMSYFYFCKISKAD